MWFIWTGLGALGYVGWEKWKQRKKPNVPISIEQYNGTKDGITVAVKQDIAFDSKLESKFTPEFMNQLTQIWLRGNTTEIKSVIDHLSSQGFKQTATAFTSRLNTLQSFKMV